MTFYLNRNGQSLPYDLDQLRALAKSGEFKQDEYVFDRRRDEWLFPNQIDELKDFWTIGEEDKTVAMQLPADFLDQLAARQKAASAPPAVHQAPPEQRHVPTMPYSLPKDPTPPPQRALPQRSKAEIALPGQTLQPRFNGTGGGLIVTMIVGYLLTMVTFGIYAPWFICKLYGYFTSSTTIEGTPRGTVQLEFNGKGGELIITWLVGILLSVITFGIYTPWFLTKLVKFFCDNTQAVASDGTRYGARFDATGGETFMALFVGALLCGVTLGIYTPWFLCNIQRFFLTKTVILENGQDAGVLTFTGEGAEFVGQFFLGMLLVIVTFGLYAAWFQVKMLQYFMSHTTLSLGNAHWRGRFSGTGGEILVLNIVGYLLTLITIGIYGAWWVVKQVKYQTDHQHYDPVS